MQFKPSLGLTLALLALSFAFFRLGLWQLDRKAEKQALFEQFDNAPPLRIEQALDRGERFARVEAWGRYDPERHILLDNRIERGRAGVHVLTPFYLTDGRALLINRGWLPLAADRRSLPEVPTGAEPRTINGILNVAPSGGPRIGGADVLVPDRWPQLVTYFDPAAVTAVLQTPLSHWQIQLDPGDESGFGAREWTAAVMGPEVHGAYAVQWLALCAATLIIWFSLGLRRGRNAAKPVAGE